MSKEQGGKTVTLGAEWQEFDFNILGANGSMPLGPGRPTLLSLQLSSPFATGGKVWIGDLSLRCEKGTAKQPCPSNVGPLLATTTVTSAQ